MASISENRRNYTPQAGFVETLEQIVDEIKVGTAQQTLWATELKRSDAQGIIDQASRLLAANPDLDESHQEIVRREIAYFTAHSWPPPREPII